MEKVIGAAEILKRAHIKKAFCQSDCAALEENTYYLLGQLMTSLRGLELPGLCGFRLERECLEEANSQSGRTASEKLAILEKV